MPLLKLMVRMPGDLFLGLVVTLGLIMFMLLDLFVQLLRLTHVHGFCNVG